MTPRGADTETAPGRTQAPDGVTGRPADGVTGRPAHGEVGRVVRSDASLEIDGPEAAPGPRAPVSRATDREGSRSGNPVPEADVAGMFDAITPVYDRMNTLMTLGSDARWRRRAVAETALGPAEAVIDVACGTGKLTALLAGVVGPFGRAEGIDLSPVMIEKASARYRSMVQLRFQVGNALSLPFADGEFDAATIAFGLRNLADFEGGFRELRRVVRPGGRVVCLELSLPRSRTWARVFHGTFRRVAPVAASIIGGRRSAYRYLPDSLDGFPPAERLALLMRSAGLTDVRFWRLSTGVVALHRGTVPD
ncbi:MAG: ubiquinone/menaquinone biosynthesis methyltransferase [Chloroflexi bacterium]|nr:ubiquinone/menaquinone biosynthesis methyltransferase [Chloroflexota bacterium]